MSEEDLRVLVEFGLAVSEQVAKLQKKYEHDTVFSLLLRTINHDAIEIARIADKRRQSELYLKGVVK